MTRSHRVKILSTCCFLLAASACSTTRESAPLRPDLDHAERMVCAPAPENRPVLPPKLEMDWQAILVPGDAISTLRAAQESFSAYVKREVERNAVVSTYLVTIEGQLFVCSSNMQWWRDYWAQMPDPAP